MSISRQQLKEYTEALEELVQLAQLDVRTTFDIYEPLGFAEALEEVIIAAQASSDYYGDMAATLAAELYEQLAYDEAGLTLDAMLADDCNHVALENNIEYAAHNHLFDGSADTDGFLNFVDGVMDKAVKQPARETIIENAARDEKTGVRYARIPSSGACSFCIMLGSRGWVYHSEQTAGSLGQYHRNCACAIVPSWEKSPRVEGYDPDALYDQWKNGTINSDTVEESTQDLSEIAEKLKEKGLSEKHSTAIAKLIENCPDKSMKTALLWSLDDLKFDDLRFSGTAHYSLSTHGISIDIDKVSREGAERSGHNDYQTLFHEWGHLIDAKLSDYETETFKSKRETHIVGRYQSSDLLASTAKTEANNLVNQWVKRGVESGNLFSSGDKWKFDYDYLRKLDPDGQSDLADIVQGATNSKVGYGHPKTYFMPSRGGMNQLGTETFAHFSELAVANPEGYEFLQETLSDSYNIWQEILEGIAS